MLTPSIQVFPLLARKLMVLGKLLSKQGCGKASLPSMPVKSLEWVQHQSRLSSDAKLAPVHAGLAEGQSGSPARLKESKKVVQSFTESC